MDFLTVAAGAVNQTPMDWDGNRRRISTAIRKAREQGVHLLCLPELCITGYGCEDAFLSLGLQQKSIEVLVEIAAECHGIAVALGVPLAVNGSLYNTAAFIVEGKILGFVAKQNLAGEGIYYEPRWFKPWKRGQISHVKINGGRIPVGDVLFELRGVRIGFEICEDGWVADRPAKSLCSSGAQILLNPSASHFAFGKNLVRRRTIFDTIKSTKVAYIYANLLGCDAGRIIFDGDCFIGSHGKLVAQSPRLTFQEVELLVTQIKVPKVPRRRSAKRIVKHKAAFFANKSKLAVTARRALWEESEFLKYEEFTRAVMLGLFDYMRKSKSHGFVVSLSGGVDSSAAACLVRLMVDAALAELGVDEFASRLSFIPGVSKLKTGAEISKNLLTCVYQRSQNSSKDTRDAAAAIALEVEAKFLELSIAKLVEEYTQVVGRALGRRFSWKEDDIALQNIQARVRSPSVWLIANVQRSLLLTTSNRSEAAVGYTTMDGDTSGGLSPLGGIDKAFLRLWCRWLQTDGPVALRRVKSMKLVTSMAPTAELRPLGSKQTDEGDLMPYEVLDVIERFAIRDKLTPIEVFLKVNQSFNNRFSRDTLEAWVTKFFKLWSINQWKRERYAPSFHLDDENLDPKTWCRFPILSGGFEVELCELKEFVSRQGRPVSKSRRGN